MKKKILKIFIICIAAVVLLVLLAVSVASVWDRILYWDFYKNSEKGFATPGVWSGFVQQGFDYIEERGVYITSGYMSNGDASRIYITNSEGDSTFVSLKFSDGSDNLSHAGGVTYYKDLIYVTGTGENDGKSSTVDIYKVDDVLDGDGVATACDQMEICVKPSFIYARAGKLYVGEFYKKGSYETDPSHHLKTPNGEENHALIAVYMLGENGKSDSIVPDHVMSVRDMVQGMTFDNKGRLVLSTSYGTSAGHLYIYDADTTVNVMGGIEIEGVPVRVRYFEEKDLDCTIETPPMIEEMVFDYENNKLLIMTESACMKYIYGKFTSGNHIYAYDYSTVK